MIQAHVITGAPAPDLRLRAGVSILRVKPNEYLVLEQGGSGCVWMGPGEHRLLELLLEGRSAKQIIAQFAESTDAVPSRRDIEAFVENLLQLGLVEATALGTSVAAPVSNPAPRHSRLLNASFDVLTVIGGWILHPLWSAPIALLGIIAVNVVFRRWGAVAYDIDRITREFPLWLIALGFVLPNIMLMSTLQSLLLGMTCRKFHGTVQALRLRTWNYLALYVEADLGDSCALFERRGLLTSIALGPWFAVGWGSACVILWSQGPRGSLLSEACLLAGLACVVRLLILLNPFVERSTAQLMICDALDNWSLWQWIREETWAWVTGSAAPRALSHRERTWIRAAGVANIAYRILLVVLIVGLAFGALPVGRSTAHLIGGLTLLIWLNRDALQSLLAFVQIQLARALSLSSATPPFLTRFVR